MQLQFLLSLRSVIQYIYNFELGHIIEKKRFTFLRLRLSQDKCTYSYCNILFLTMLYLQPFYCKTNIAMKPLLAE